MSRGRSTRRQTAFFPLRSSCFSIFFRSQVALNQLVLGPVVVSAVFAWSLSWSGRLAEFPEKWRRDTLPTLRKGWAFWVPASSINFACAPSLRVWCTCGMPVCMRATGRGCAHVTPCGFRATPR
jgi:hypothetical protein